VIVRKQDWITLGTQPNWIEAGRIITRLDPTKNLKQMSLRDIAEFFSSRGIAVPQGGRDPSLSITDEEYAAMTGGMN